MKDAKQRLRQTLRAHPATGDSRAICQNILESDWFSRAETVMAYAAMKTEPNLDMVLEEILRQGKTLVLPRCEAGDQLSGRIVQDLSQRIPGMFGILEPPPAAPVADKTSIDLILVPGMAFDWEGGRLGRGKGYYDRYLRDYGGRTLGVCFRSALLEQVPMDSHDCRVDAVVTEEGIRGTEERR